MSERPDPDGGGATVTAELLRRYDKAGPRYTSYPPATEFHAGVTADRYSEHLAQAALAADEPLSLYLHLPFCEERCLYCGCNVVITKKRPVMRHYVDVLYRELDDVAARLGERRTVRQYHWGGGTPTYLTPEETREVQEHVLEHFTLADDAEVAIEVDPRVTTTEHLDVLKEVGFNRLSMGVQDFTLEVQEAVNRVQSYEQTAALIEHGRKLGFESVNIDLIYGLPKQSVGTFRETLRLVNRIRPERVAVYSYAHLPHIKGNQRTIDVADLPPPDVKIELFASAIRAFSEAGYLSVGMDHFALPEDEMGQAIANGTLWRNFMGYTVRHAPDMVAIGMSSIGDVAGAFFQNHKKLIEYERAVDAGTLPIERGYVLTSEDHIRRHVITALMCTFRLDKRDVEKRFGLEFDVHFASSLANLAPMEADGFVEITPDTLRVIGLGKLFIRNICMAFDPYLERQPTDGRPRFSRTV